MRYIAKVHTVNNSEIGEYQTNKIVLLDGEQVVDEIEDVSVNGEAAQRLAALLEREQVSAEQFRYVVEDFVAEL